ncbi:hypothetical protein BOX15_Mlig004889g1 [Macrostomum lignano]|uniref:RING-type domain-containing protein n=1 Tax=Macrostomum lignano TaxID=282301 RepID=A0A267GX82_9PLAT|nr:hypothetical protein BOX15_Mlig004889g1 [Macrostomum lignano]
MVKCAVLGCGLMGCKIAGELARQGHRVKMTDSNAEVLNSAYQRMEEDKQELLREGLLMQGAFPGQVLCLSRLEETVSDAEFIFEAVHDNLDTKSDLLEKVSHVCQPEAVISTNTLHLDVNEVFARCAKRERCLGLRFLFPVYYIPEVEINPSRDTSSSTTERVRRLLEDMGKTLFFRSGGNPLILTEEQREERRRVVLEQLHRSSGFGRAEQANSVPALGWGGGGGGGGYHHSQQLHQVHQVQQQQLQQLLQQQQSECAICLDRARDCLLSPCHHLALCCTCAQLLHSRRDFCPVCRQPIQDVIKVYHT